MKGMDMNGYRLDLKVCEGCGALWLRRGVMDGVYCWGCAKRLAAFPAPRARHAGGRPRGVQAGDHQPAVRASRCRGTDRAVANGGAR